MSTDFQNSFTVRLNSKHVMKHSLNIPSHLKCVATLPCENKCQETTDNLKQMSCLTINFNLNLLQSNGRRMFWLIYVALNIQKMSSHGSNAGVEMSTPLINVIVNNSVALQLTHQSDTTPNHSHPALPALFFWWTRCPRFCNEM